MPRPKKKESEKKVRVNVTLDKSVYKNLKKKGTRLSTTINQLLRVANLNNTEDRLSVGSSPTRCFFDSN
ncbi:MAG: BrnA antitoxin family protein [Nanoarchaeota archaeon]